MTLNYELNSSTLSSGYREHHRLRDQSHLYKYLTAIAFTLLGIYIAFIRPVDHVHAAIAGFVGLVIWLQLRIPFAIRAQIKQHAKTGKIPNQIGLEANIREMSLTDSRSNGTFLWECLIDYKICTNGILLYPHENIFYWIPNTASVEGGTWQDFESLVSNKIQRKI